MAHNTNTLTGKSSKQRTSLASQNRRKTGRRRKAKSGKINLSKLLPALVIETLAVIAILAIFFGMKAARNREARLELPLNQPATIEPHFTALEFSIQNISRLSIDMAN